MKRYKELRRSVNLCRTVRFNRGPKKLSRRRRNYKKHLASAYFRKLRLERFAFDGYRCQCGCGEGPFPPSQLACDHVTYKNFGHETLEDVRTMLREHHDAKDGWKWQGWGQR